MREVSAQGYRRTMGEDEHQDTTKIGLVALRIPVLILLALVALVVIGTLVL